MSNLVQSKKSSEKEKVTVVRCSKCGAEIMVEPNVKLASEAIEAHVEQHISKLKNPAKDETQADRIRDDLIAQVFVETSKQ